MKRKAVGPQEGLMYDANAHYLLMQRKQSRRRESMPAASATDNRASLRIMPGMKERDEETRMDRILKPYRGRTYEGPTEPEVT